MRGDEADQLGEAAVVEIRPGEIPVFWACGVTPQAVITKTRPGFCITHAPGYMLVTDISNGTLATG